MDAWIHGLLKAVGSSIVALPWVPVETRPCLVDHAGLSPQGTNIGHKDMSCFLP